MGYLIKNANVFSESCFLKADLLVSGGVIARVATSIDASAGDEVFEFDNCYVFPGFTDVHVHLREPGFSYKETIASGTMAAAHGGYTRVCAMPNLSPVPDCVESIRMQRELIRSTAKIPVFPYAAITVGESGETLSDMDALAPLCAAFSDDGKGVQNDDVMRSAMKKATSLGKIIAAHCEDNSLLNGGYIHSGEYARLHSHRGICSESEWRPIERDLKLAEETGCAYHVCHISAKESVELIRNAKAHGVDVTCETAPHYLTLNDMMLKDEGRFKMNPPVRSEADRLALIEGIRDGTIDMIATDHAPHSEEEKSKGLAGSLMGITGLEAAFPVLYTELVKSGVISLQKLIELMSVNPLKRFFGEDCRLSQGSNADFTVFELDSKFTINPQAFFSKGKSTPFAGKEVSGKCKMTVVSGRIIWQEN